MTSLRTRPHSFVGGELSPSMYGRPDDPKYQHGAASMRNMLTVGPAGDAMSRPGSQFVRAAGNETRKARLIRYDTGGGEAFQVELGARSQYPGSSIVPGYARFHRNGATVLHSVPWDAATAYEAGNVVLLGGVLYLCTAANTNTSPPNVAFWKLLEWVGHKAFVPGDVNVLTSEITIAAGHGLVTGDPVEFANDAAAPITYVQAPSVVVALEIAYAVVIDSTTLQVSATPGGAPLTLVSAGSGNHRIYRRYSPGEIVSHAGSAFYCRATQPITILSVLPNAGNETYWYQMPATGEYEIPTTLALTDAELFAATYSQESDRLSIATGKTYVCEVLLIPATSTTPAHWRWLQVSFAPSLVAPGSVAVAATKRGATIKIESLLNPTLGLVIRTVAEHRLVEGLDYVRVEGSADANLNGKFFAVQTFGQDQEFYPIDADTGEYVTFTTAAGGGFVQVTKLNSDDTNRYVVTAVDDDDRESVASTEQEVTNNLFVTGAFNTVSWAAVTGAIRYRIYKQQGATGLFGLIGETEGLTFKDDSIAPELGKAPPRLDVSLGSAPDFVTLAGARDDLPRAVAHMEGRRVFGGTAAQSQDVWMTRTNSESDLSFTIPIRATDRIRQRLKSRIACSIRHLVPLAQMVALTDTTEFRITPFDSAALTPESFAARAQSYVGASEVQPVVVDNQLLFVQARRGRVYQMGYSAEANGYLPVDLTDRSTHLFDGFDIVQMAVQRDPVSVVWCVRSDGKLLGLTYVPAQQVFAWHVHETDGDVESVSVGGEGDEDRVYVVVKRVVDGVTRRYVERLASFLPGAWADQWLADAGLKYSGAEVETVAGLDHLEGKIVSVFADGLVQTQKTVVGGQITLDVAASTVIVGLPVVYELRSLPAAFAIEAFGGGRPKSVTNVWVRVEQSGRFELGPTLDAMSTPIEIEDGAPFSGEVKVRAPNAWTESGQLYLRQNDPVPLRVNYIIAEMAIGG